MRKSKSAEKLRLEEISAAAQVLRDHQRGLSIGQLIAMIRHQLRMSQSALAERSATPQSTLSKIESGRQQPLISTLNKILDALDCDLLISAVPRNNLEEILQRQAEKKARVRVKYLKGTMSLEDQIPEQKFLNEMTKEEVERLKRSSSSELWGKE